LSDEQGDEQSDGDANDDYAPASDADEPRQDVHDEQDEQGDDNSVAMEPDADDESMTSLPSLTSSQEAVDDESATTSDESVTQTDTSTGGDDDRVTSNDRLWIEKPSGGQHGIGMKVHRGCTKLRKRHGHCRPLPSAKKYFVMEYLNPSLLFGHKFDVRSFLVVASLDPLLVFYHDGFARRATNKYSSDVSDSTAHITNSEGQDSKDDHFWDFGRLDDYLAQHTDFPTPFMRGKFKQHARKVENFVFQVCLTA
jgi:hypothetical protein